MNYWTKFTNYHKKNQTCWKPTIHVEKDFNETWPTKKLTSQRQKNVEKSVKSFLKNYYLRVRRKGQQTYNKSDTFIVPENNRLQLKNTNLCKWKPVCLLNQWFLSSLKFYFILLLEK